MVEKSKNGSIKAEDLVNLVASPEMQKTLSENGLCKPSISKRIAARWLQKLDWQYQCTRNGLYINGHKREDIVAYRCEFVDRWKTYNMRSHRWNDDGLELPHPNGFPVPDGLPFRLVLITHDESTFYQNDQRKIVWAQTTSWPTPQPKGEGQPIMISDFLTSEWGCLRDGHEFVCHLPPLPFTNLSLGKPKLSSRLARIRMVILVPTISSRKSILQSTFSKVSPKVISRPFFFLIMHRAIKNELKMQYQLGKCRKVCPPPFLSFFFFSNFHRHRAKKGLNAPPQWVMHATRPPSKR